MKRIACLVAAASLLALGARADDEKSEKIEKDKNHVTIEKKTDGSGTKVESKARHRMGGGTVSKTTTDEKHKTAQGHTLKKKTTRTVEKDANGNVVRKEEKVEH